MPRRQVVLYAHPGAAPAMAALVPVSMYPPHAVHMAPPVPALAGVSRHALPCPVLPCHGGACTASARFVWGLTDSDGRLTPLSPPRTDPIDRRQPGGGYSPHPSGGPDGGGWAAPSALASYQPAAYYAYPPGQWQGGPSPPPSRNRSPQRAPSRGRGGSWGGRRG